MYERSRNEHACAKVSREEQGIVRNREVGKASDDDGKGAGCSAQEEDEEQGEDVQRRVVVVFGTAGAAGWAFTCLLTANYFGVEGLKRYIRPRWRWMGCERLWAAVLWV